MTEKNENLKREKRNHTLSIRQSDTPQFKEFIKNQTNFNESMRYLIYQFISQEGTADISTKIYDFKK